VLTGKAKFGIFGDGKEVAQVAMARSFRNGDYRSGYYRDQTLMFALGLLTVREFFAQLYADASLEREPCSGGRQMTAHFATRLLEEDGEWRSQLDGFNVAADLSPTASQMPKLVGLAYSSKLYRELEGLDESGRFSRNGDEVAFGTIGDASCAEGLFWESVNAAGVLGAPMILSVWDDGFGISVPTERQVTKGDISQLVRGFQRAPGDRRGYDIYTAKGWDYPGLCETYLTASEIVRLEHVPAIIHVQELTQPQGHSTSGSHERYKTAGRLAWEAEHDCLRRMRAWMEREGIASSEELDAAEAEDRQLVRGMQREAWEAFRAALDEDRSELQALLATLEEQSSPSVEVEEIRNRLERLPNPLRRDLQSAATEALIATRGQVAVARQSLLEWREEMADRQRERFGTHLYSETGGSALTVPVVAPIVDDAAPEVRGFEVLNACFDRALERVPNLVAFGEDLGRLGDVNQGFSGLQEKYGELRVSDAGIREATILGQAIGMALRGLRPLAEIQYLDYLLYCLQIMSDDLATLRWRTKAGQKAPVIVRTRGHRLEGVWHSGSPLAGIIHLLRGIYVCVPRNMTQAAGFYNTLLRADDPALVIEVLNAYRAKERLPHNVGEFTVPLGVPEVLREGSDVTLVTYGALCKISLEAAERLAAVGVETEVIDVQTLLPFDIGGRITESVKKTNRILFVDEDVPGGATAYMAQKVIEEQGAFAWLDAAPRTLSSAEHRPVYGSDGDYSSKPNRESIFEAVYDLVREGAPGRFPPVF
jgi:pyruvate/2-oxoglutarate/acetoin dehydrogenase E1 component/TPP-dependent pyruvate/acetoin dehydrogenase alpha subunit